MPVTIPRRVQKCTPAQHIDSLSRHAVHIVWQAKVEIMQLTFLNLGLEAPPALSSRKLSRHDACGTLASIGFRQIKLPSG